MERQSPPTERGPAGQLDDTRAAPPPLLAHATALALAILLGALYSRLRKEDLLSAPHRARILAALHEKGPQRAGALAKLTGVDRTTIEYHTSQLERAGLVHAHRRGRWVFIALPGQDVPEDHIPSAALTAMVRDAIASRGGEILRTELHAALPTVPQRTRNHTLRQLVASGAVRETVTGAGHVLTLAR